MMKGLIMALLASAAIAQTPIETIQYDGKINDLAAKGGLVLIATDCGIYHLKEGRVYIGIPTNCLQISGDTLRFVTTNGVYRKEDMKTGQLLDTFQIGGLPPDSSERSVFCSGLQWPWLLVNGGSGYRDSGVWNITDRTIVNAQHWFADHLHSRDLRGLVYSRDSFWIASASDREIYQLSNDVPTRQIIKTVEFPDVTEGKLAAFTIDGSTLWVAFETYNGEYRSRIHRYKWPVKAENEKEEK